MNEPAVALEAPLVVAAPDAARPAGRSAVRLRAALILGLTLLAFGLRAYHLGFQSLWRDEADALRFATQKLPDLLHMFTDVGQNGPLFFLMLRPWVALAGHGEFALRFLSACFGTLAVPLSFRLLDRLAGTRPALVLALLMAIAPYQVWYGQEAKMYALLSFLIPLELYLALLAVQTRRKRYWVALYVTTGLSIYTHLLAVLAVPVELLFILLAPERTHGQAAEDAPVAAGGRAIARRALWALGFLAALVLPFLPVLRWGLPLFLSWSYGTGFAFVPLPTILTVMVGVFTRGPLAVMGLPIMPMVLAVIAGAVLWPAAQGKAGWRPAALLLGWLLLPAIGIYVVSLSAPVFTERYVIWAMPAFLSLAALGVVVLGHAWRPLGLAVLGLVVAIGLTDTAYYQQASLKSDFRGAAAYVRAHQRPGDRLIFLIPHGRFTFEYYYGPVAGFGDGPYTNNGAAPEEVDQWMTTAVNGAPAVWLIATEVPLWDQGGLDEAWLAARGAITDRAGFTLVQVTRYAITPAPPPGPARAFIPLLPR